MAEFDGRLDPEGHNNGRIVGTYTVTINWDVPHEHNWQYSNNNDGTHRRWCEGCDTVVESEAHTYRDGVCACGARQPVNPQPDPEPEQPSDPAPDPDPIVPASGQSSQNDSGQTDDITAPEPENSYRNTVKAVNNQLDEKIKNFSDPLNNWAGLAYTDLLQITLDTGNWYSFDKGTYEKIDYLVAQGVTITINYVYKNKQCSLTIPGGCAAQTASFCDPKTGCIGFEDLKGKLLEGEYIYPEGLTEAELEAYKAELRRMKEQKQREAVSKARSLAEARAATTTLINAGADMLASQGFAQAANAVAADTSTAAKNDEANGNGGANSGSSFTPFSAFGSSGMRAESG